jgi:hypothetical protein
MKRLWVIFASLVLLAGCAYFEERIDAAGKCASDPACLQRVQEVSKAAKAVGDATGFPWAGAAAGGVVSAMMLFFARRKENGK